MRTWIVIGLMLFGRLAHAQQSGNVEIIADPAIDKMEKDRISRRSTQGSMVPGYRIMIGFYSSRTEANAKLAEAQRLFGSKYGAVLQYDEPNFKVYVGEFRSATSADAAIAEVKSRFPGARRVRDLIKSRRKEG
ncbi:MAG: SPOR domain-containing protein [Bacteroidetes bacterium]|nr:SPOR domain-containing protein [Bacteroidota bacterium]